MTHPAVLPENDLASRREARLAALPAAYKAQPERLCYELALALEDPLVIFARYGYDGSAAVAMLQTEEFAKTLNVVAQAVKDGGMRFRAKARAMAEDLLPEAYQIATDELASSAVRADLIQWMARVADLEPAPKTKDGGGSGGGGFNLSIVFSGQAPQAVITGREPITIEG